MASLYVLFYIILMISRFHVTTSESILSENLIKEFYNGFLLLDHDKNGVVNAYESSLGLLALNQNPSTNKMDTTKVKCSISPDSVDFVDCIRIITQNKLITNELSINDIIDFDEMKSIYLNTCDDILPSQYKNGNCYDLVSDDGGLKAFGYGICSSNNNKYCRLSCRTCEVDHYKTSILSNSNNENNSQLLNKINKQSLSNQKSAVVLASSDWHIEPWYQIDKGGDVSRYSNATIDNMWNCFDSNGNIVSCLLTGESDPPIDFITSHLQSVQNMSYFNGETTEIITPQILFYPGDTQAHDYSGGNINNCNESLAISNLMRNSLQTISNYFSTDNTFISAGNNDGPHDSVFVEGGNEADTKAYSDALIEFDIVNNNLKLHYIFDDKIYNQVEFFEQTGYYVKQLDPNNNFGLKYENLFVVIINTNLGRFNMMQNFALVKDLEMINNLNGSVYLIGHHPGIVLSIIPSNYTHLLKGSYAGHVHFALPTITYNHFTQLPSVSQCAFTTGYYIGIISNENNYILSLSLFNNLYEYEGPINELADSDDWVIHS